MDMKDYYLYSRQSRFQVKNKTLFGLTNSELKLIDK